MNEVVDVEGGFVIADCTGDKPLYWCGTHWENDRALAVVVIDAGAAARVLTHLDAAEIGAAVVRAAIPLALEYEQGQMSDRHEIHRPMWKALVAALEQGDQLPDLSA